MYVCLCEGVSDREVRACVRAGASSVREVGRACGAGTGCGACHAEIRELLAEASPSKERAHMSLPMMPCPA